MFSFRRKQRTAQPTPIPTSPSLPQLHSRGLSWPPNLVDASSIDNQENEDTNALNGASRITFGGDDHGGIPFHKPSRMFPAGEGVPISSLYMSSPPSAFDRVNKSATAPSLGRSQRRARAPPTFNLMVVGAQGTGKTALLRLLLESADLSPAATVDQRAAVDKFLAGTPRKTQAINTVCAEICESRFERVLLSVIDTPGLDFSQGRELTLERQVNTIMKYIDAQYADTMSEESKVVRQSKGDQHIHLCIYMVDPAAMTAPTANTPASSLPKKTQSETTISQRNPPDLVPDTSSGEETDEDEEDTIALPAAELRVIRRLSNRVNVLPVIAKADYLTDEKLAAVKEAVRAGLADAGLNFGVFGNSTDMKVKAEEGTPRPREPSDTGHTASSTSHSAESEGRSEESTASELQNADEVIQEDERTSRPVIKLRASLRHKRSISRSRSRRDLSQAAEDERRPALPDATDPESIANLRFSAQNVASTDLAPMLPFALISPEISKRRRRVLFTDSPSDTAPTSPTQQSEDEDSQSTNLYRTSSMRTQSFFQGPPVDLKGVFIRKFRWGTVDVLNPGHCDFAAFRTAIMTTHQKVLKTYTKEVLYEKYRTEKLLVYRATSKISEEEKQRLLADMGL